MSAFDESDFGWENDQPSHRRDNKRQRSRSRSGGRHHRDRFCDERPRRRQSSRDNDRGERRQRSRSPRSSSAHNSRQYQKQETHVAPQSSIAQPTASSPLFRGAKRDTSHLVRSFPFDHCTMPTGDWWCAMCSNPNPQERWDCVKCGSLHVESSRSMRPSIELMSDFVSVPMVQGIAAAAANGAYHPVVSMDLSAAALRYHGGDCAPEDERALLLGVVESVLRTKPECNSLLMFEALVEDAVLQNGCEGYVVCMRFYSVPLAKQCVMALQSCVSLPGIVPTDGSRFALPGKLRFGFSTRRAIPKPPAPASSSIQDAPILDIHEEKPASEAPSVWEPPVVANDADLREYLVKLFNQWDTLLPSQKEYYEANIARVTQQPQAQPKCTTSGDRAPATVVPTPTMADPSAIKKRLEEKRVALLEAKRQREQEASSPNVQTPAQPPIPSAPVAGPATVLEKLALKRAQLQMKQQQQQVSPSPPSAGVPASVEAAPTVDAPAKQPPALSLLSMLPMPPNFPTKTDYAKQTKTINPKAIIHLRGIPMDVSSRVLNPVFL